MNKLIWIFLLIIVFESCAEKADELDPVLFQSSLNEIDTIPVGKELVVPIDFQLGKNSVIAVRNIYGSFELAQTKNKNKIIIPAKYLKQQGVMEIEVWTNNKKDFYQKYYLRSNDSVSTMENYFGQKFIQLGKENDSEVITFFMDEFGNIITNRNAVHYSFIQDNSQNLITQQSEELLHTQAVPYGNLSGKAKMSVFSNNIYSEEQSYYVNSGPAQNFSIQEDFDHYLADGNSIYQLKTSVLKDKFGNIISDGTQVRFVIEDKNKNTSEAFATTIDGIAKASLIAPSRSGNYTISAYSLPEAKSNILKVQLHPAVEEIPSIIRNNQIEIGPIYTKNKNLVAFGTPVLITFYNTANQKISSKMIRTEKGRAQLIIPQYLNEAKTIQLQCLDASSPQIHIP